MREVESERDHTDEIKSDDRRNGKRRRHIVPYGFVDVRGMKDAEREVKNVINDEEEQHESRPQHRTRAGR